MGERLLFRVGYQPDFLDLSQVLNSLKGSFALLESSRKAPEDRKDLLFHELVEELVFAPGDSPQDFLKKIERFLSQGLWLVGFFTYEFGYSLERRLFPHRRLPFQVPLAWFGVFRPPLIFSKNLWAPSKGKVELCSVSLNMNFLEYQRAFHRIKDYIAAGDTYQVNFTLKYHFTTEASPEELYFSLRRKQRVRYAGLIKTDDFSILSLSPELFLRRQGGRLWTSPMKGTAPRGRFSKEDEDIARWLSSDRKNQAENVMIVDLLRNDLGRVCAPGSVYVRELFKVERYETVHQMISTVEGTLAPGTDLYRVFSALFPCGSVTGAPKIRTMEIIAELEKEPRGVYTGAFGYFSPDGEFVFNVAIRTVVLSGGTGEFGIGSGVVWDSEAEKEYEECRLKAKFLLEDPPSFKLIETMLFVPDKGFPLKERHLERLLRSAEYFNFSVKKERIEALLEKAAHILTSPAKVRLLLDEQGFLELEAYELKPIETPVKIGLMKRPVPKEERFLYHKTTHRPWYEEARKKAREEGLFEIVFLNEDDELTEGTITNLFIEKNGRLFTPRLTAGLLPGVLRETLLSSGKAKESRLTLADLETADRLYVGNAVRGLLPVEKWVRLSA